MWYKHFVKKLVVQFVFEVYLELPKMKVSSKHERAKNKILFPSLNLTPNS